MRPMSHAILITCLVAPHSRPRTTMRAIAQEVDECNRWSEDLGLDIPWSLPLSLLAVQLLLERLPPQRAATASSPQPLPLCKIESSSCRNRQAVSRKPCDELILIQEKFRREVSHHHINDDVDGHHIEMIRLACSCLNLANGAVGCLSLETACLSPSSAPEDFECSGGGPVCAFYRNDQQASQSLLPTTASASSNGLHTIRQSLPLSSSPSMSLLRLKYLSVMMR